MSSTVSGQELVQWYRRAKIKAIAADIDLEEVDWFLQEVAGLDRLALRLESFKTRSHIPLKFPLSILTQQWERRLQDRIPLQYLVGVTPWRRFSLKVSPAVLIPRPETEEIIDIALKAVEISPIPHLDSGNWVDMGTGSGAIALGLADVLTNATIYATDVSPEALAIAQENVITGGYSDRIHCCLGSWWQPLAEFQGKISGMVSNPPYIPTDTIETLQPEVARYEPKTALDGGKDGLDSLRYLINTAVAYLHSGGIWLVEVMAGQATIVAQQLHETENYENIQIFQDLSGIDRFVLAYRR